MLSTSLYRYTTGPKGITQSVWQFAFIGLNDSGQAPSLAIKIPIGGMESIGASGQVRQLRSSPGVEKIRLLCAIILALLSRYRLVGLSLSSLCAARPYRVL